MQLLVSYVVSILIYVYSVVEETSPCSTEVVPACIERDRKNVQISNQGKNDIIK